MVSSTLRTSVCLSHLRIIENADSDPQSLGWGLGAWISNILPGQGLEAHAGWLVIRKNISVGSRRPRPNLSCASMSHVNWGKSHSESAASPEKWGL